MQGDRLSGLAAAMQDWCVKEGVPPSAVHSAQVDGLPLPLVAVLVFARWPFAADRQGEHGMSDAAWQPAPGGKQLLISAQAAAARVPSMDRQLLSSASYARRTQPHSSAVWRQLNDWSDRHPWFMALLDAVHHWFQMPDEPFMHMLAFRGAEWVAQATRAQEARASMWQSLMTELGIAQRLQVPVHEHAWPSNDPVVTGEARTELLPQGLHLLNVLLTSLLSAAAQAQQLPQSWSVDSADALYMLSMASLIDRSLKYTVQGMCASPSSAHRLRTHAPAPPLRRLHTRTHALHSSGAVSTALDMADVAAAVSQPVPMPEICAQTALDIMRQASFSHELGLPALAHAVYSSAVPSLPDLMAALPNDAVPGSSLLRTIDVWTLWLRPWRARLAQCGVAHDQSPKQLQAQFPALRLHAPAARTAMLAHAKPATSSKLRAHVLNALRGAVLQPPHGSSPQGALWADPQLPSEWSNEALSGAWSTPQLLSLWATLGDWGCGLVPDQAWAPWVPARYLLAVRGLAAVMLQATEWSWTDRRQWACAEARTAWQAKHGAQEDHTKRVHFLDDGMPGARPGGARTRMPVLQPEHAALDALERVLDVFEPGVLGILLAMSGVFAQAHGVQLQHRTPSSGAAFVADCSRAWQDLPSHAAARLVAAAAQCAVSQAQGWDDVPLLHATGCARDATLATHRLARSAELVLDRVLEAAESVAVATDWRPPAQLGQAGLWEPVLQFAQRAWEAHGAGSAGATRQQLPELVRLQFTARRLAILFGLEDQLRERSTAAAARLAARAQGMPRSTLLSSAQALANSVASVALGQIWPASAPQSSTASATSVAVASAGNTAAPLGREWVAPVSPGNGGEDWGSSPVGSNVKFAGRTPAAQARQIAPARDVTPSRHGPALLTDNGRYALLSATAGAPSMQVVGSAFLGHTSAMPPATWETGITLLASQRVAIALARVAAWLGLVSGGVQPGHAWHSLLQDSTDRLPEAAVSRALTWGTGRVVPLSTVLYTGRLLCDSNGVQAAIAVPALAKTWTVQQRLQHMMQLPPNCVRMPGALWPAWLLAAIAVYCSWWQVLADPGAALWLALLTCVAVLASIRLAR